MTDKEFNLIYDYMKWFHDGIEHDFDSNSAWEVVQEIERRKEWFYFLHSHLRQQNQGKIPINYSDYIKWLYNPTNFFNCFAKWLLSKEETQ